MWVVSRERMGKYVATERLILGNQLITENGFHGYENWKLKITRNQTAASELTHGFWDNAFMKSSRGILEGGDLYSVLSNLQKGVHFNSEKG
jgi:hypothetical protein